MKIKIKEKELQKLIMDWLEAKNIFHYRNNSGVMFKEYKGKMSMVRFGAVGSPDVIAVIDGRYIGIECKGTGGKQSDHQKVFQEQLEKAGGIYILAWDLSDVYAHPAIHY